MGTFLADTAANQTVDGPSATFTYRRLGPRGGIPLVLLNRVRGTLDWWDPQFLDLLAADHDVIVFDTVGTGYTTGTPRDSVEGFADAAIEFVGALGLARVDLLGWTLGGTTAQQVALRRPDLVRKLVLAASSPGGRLPGAPAPDPRVRAVMARPETTPDELVYLFFPDTDPGRAAGHAHLARVATRLAGGGAVVSEQVTADLATIGQPVLCATGMRDVMIPALAAYTAVQHLPDATLLIYGDAGHAFLFQHAHTFTAQVATFLAA